MVYNCVIWEVIRKECSQYFNIERRGDFPNKIKKKTLFPHDITCI